MSTPKKNNAHSIVWFEIPADDLQRAKKFYGSLFGWKVNAFPGKADYLHLDTSGRDASPDGALMARMHPGHTITNYISVESINRYCAKITKLGGEICVPKTAVPGMGFFAICKDTENNTFAIWEVNEKAK
jgi:predicted enzyme related to lactoylglutathione lyase